ncbi:MAG: hypothetical protein AB7G15_13125 [Alphaproteobacteria bacterium]
MLDDAPSLTANGVVVPVPPARGVTVTRETLVGRALRYSDSGPMIVVSRG